MIDGVGVGGRRRKHLLRVVVKRANNMTKEKGI